MKFKMAMGIAALVLGAGRLNADYAQQRFTEYMAKNNSQYRVEYVSGTERVVDLGSVIGGIYLLTSSSKRDTKKDSCRGAGGGN